jgi:hypothetical protein
MRAVTKGQILALYSGDICLGGGPIDSPGSWDFRRWYMLLLLYCTANPRWCTICQAGSNLYLADGVMCAPVHPCAAMWRSLYFLWLIYHTPLATLLVE